MLARWIKTIADLPPYANYLMSALKDVYRFPMIVLHHEFVRCKMAGSSDVRALDVAKRLMDYDFHPPTNYFRSVSMKR
jgi:glycine dehydrogenase subunit 2